MHGAAQLQADAAGGQLLDDVAGVGQRPGKAVKLGDRQGVAGAASRQRLTQARPGTGGTGQAVVDVDPVDVDPEWARPSRWAVRSWLVAETLA